MFSSQHSVTMIIDSVTFIGVLFVTLLWWYPSLFRDSRFCVSLSHSCTILQWLIFSHTTTTVSSRSFPLLCQFPTVLTCYLFRFTLVFCGFLYFPSLNEAPQYFPPTLKCNATTSIFTLLHWVLENIPPSSITFPARLYSLLRNECTCP